MPKSFCFLLMAGAMGWLTACTAPQPAATSLNGAVPGPGPAVHGKLGDSSDATPSNQGCELDFGTDGCNDCVDHACEESCRDLSQAQGISDWLECVAPCQTSSCIENCAPLCTDCWDLYENLDECMTRQCNETCGDQPSDSCAYSVASAACNQCMNEACLVSCSWFASSTSASSLLACWQTCDDQGCLQVCDNAYPEAAEAYEVLAQCLQAQCGPWCS